MWSIYTIGTLSMIVFSLVGMAGWKKGSDNPWEIMGLWFDRRAVVDLLAGFLISALVMTGVFVVERMSGYARATEIFLPSVYILSSPLWIFPHAFAEEFFCRGLMLNGVSMVIRKNQWLAVAISSIAFGSLHAVNPHASLVSVAGNSLGGLVYALAYLKSGRLWLGTGLHFAWNFVQGPVFGFPVSGYCSRGIVAQEWEGDIWLGGGEYGPEAGLIGMFFRFVAIALILLWCRRPKPNDATIDATI